MKHVHLIGSHYLQLFLKEFRGLIIPSNILHIPADLESRPITNAAICNFRITACLVNKLIQGLNPVKNTGSCICPDFYLIINLKFIGTLLVIRIFHLLPDQSNEDSIFIAC